MKKKEFSIFNTEFSILKLKKVKMKKKYDLKDRLIDFAVRIIRLSEKLPNTKTCKHISGQILRRGTSPAPNYGEAISAESRADFIHKLKVALKA